MGATPEHERARAWREAAGLSRPELGRRIGYSAASIRSFEEGAKLNGEPISATAWQRYRLTCAAVAAGLGAPW